jgi:hypothetical protein
MLMFKTAGLASVGLGPHCTTDRASKTTTKTIMIRVSFPRNILSSFNYFVSLREWLKNKRLSPFRCLTPFPMVEKPGFSCLDGHTVAFRIHHDTTNHIFSQKLGFWAVMKNVR